MTDCGCDWDTDTDTTRAEPSPELLAIWDDEPALAIATDTYTIHATLALEGRPVALMEALDTLEWIGNRMLWPARGTLFLAEHRGGDWHPVKVLTLQQARAWLARHKLDVPRWLQRGGGPDPLDSLLCSLARCPEMPIRGWARDLLTRGEYARN